MASGFTTLTDEHLRRSNVWSRQIKQLLLDDLNAMKFVRNITAEFPDGVTFNIPSLGEAETADFSEGRQIKYNKFDTGNFTFTFDTYKYSANAISEQFKQDSFYTADVIAAFVPRQHRALMEAVETDILSKGPAAQTAANLNQINGAAHRWVGQGTGNSIALIDFARVQNSMLRANIPLNNLVAVIDPSVAYTLQTQANLVNQLSPNPRWSSITTEGAMTGFKFMYNVYGFDCYVSNYLPNGFAETINGVAITNGVANQFFSATPGDTMPIIGGFRQMPTVYSEFNKDLQQTEYLTVARWGWKMYRPENMFVVLTDNTIVA